MYMYCNFTLMRYFNIIVIIIVIIRYTLLLHSLLLSEML